MGDLAYEKEDRGYVVRCWYGATPGDPALIRITKDDEPVRNFHYPAYKIWNIAAHFSEIVDVLTEAP